MRAQPGGDVGAQPQGTESSARAPWRKSLPESLDLAACVLLALVLPVLMIYSSRSSAAVVAGIALCGFAADQLERDRRLSPLKAPQLASSKRSAAHPLLALFVAFVALAALGILRTSEESFLFSRLAEFSGTVVVAGFGYSGFRRRGLRIAPELLTLGVGLTAGLALIELYGESPIRRLLGLDPEAFRLNRAMVTLALYAMLLAMLAGIWRRWLWVASAVALSLAAIMSSESGSAPFGLAMAACAYGLVRALPRLGPALVGAFALIAILSAPWHGALLSFMIPEWLHASLSSASSAIRVGIYRAFGEAVWLAPILGHGFNTTLFALTEIDVASLSEGAGAYLGYGHPHDAPLQLWVEMGFAGVLLAIAALGVVLSRLQRLPPEVHASGAALLAFFLAISLVSHGAWQAWWVGIIAAGLMLHEGALMHWQKEIQP